MIVAGQTEARAQLSSTIMDYHEPFDRSLRDIIDTFIEAPFTGLFSNNILKQDKGIKCNKKKKKK